jgi:hypothetical protein
MNKKLIFMGMTALLLSFGLVFAGCEQDADDDDDSLSPTVSEELRQTPASPLLTPRKNLFSSAFEQLFHINTAVFGFFKCALNIS